ncbi:hypothetical protein CEXT_353311 [Caerostris extrusa]|uniref:Uncharacterized protein n=1 Tax=Caerostris extrusa TaxID=172846 RepID=A0AAV4RLX7_CAEEX|nr:hypothetical protein CEXT_353311 [Caerostris extrusa]
MSKYFINKDVVDEYSFKNIFHARSKNRSELSHAKDAKFVSCRQNSKLHRNISFDVQVFWGQILEEILEPEETHLGKYSSLILRSWPVKRVSKTVYGAVF